MNILIRKGVAETLDAPQNIAGAAGVAAIFSYDAAIVAFFSLMGACCYVAYKWSKNDEMRVKYVVFPILFGFLSGLFAGMVFYKYPIELIGNPDVNPIWVMSMIGFTVGYSSEIVSRILPSYIEKVFKK